MFKENSIRNVALGVVIKDNKLLVENGTDKVKGITFYRCLGGGIEKNELPDEAVKREFAEELNINITVKKELGVIDSVFTYNGKNGHEIVYLFDIEIPDEKYNETYIITDNGKTFTAEWIDINQFKTNKKILFPEGMLKYL